MAIDSSIISRLQPPAPVQQADPIERYGKSLALKNLMMQGDQGEQALADDKAQRDAFIAAKGDSKIYRQLLGDRGQYKAVQALDKAELDNSAKQASIGKDNAAAEKSKFDVAIGEVQHGSAILQAAKENPQAWPAIRRVFAMQFPKQAAELPEQFDPSFIDAKIAAGQTITQRLQDQRSREQQAEAARHNKQTEQNTVRGQNMVDSRSRESNEQGKTQIVTDADGNITVVNKNTAVARPAVDAAGAPLRGNPKPLTESQGKASGLASRAQAAHDILNTLEDSGTMTPGVIKQGAGSVPLIGGALEMGVNKLPAWAGGPNANQQKVEQAQRDFVNAALRVESGASINPSEFENARKQYFAQPGDLPEVIAQKRRAREIEIESLKMQGGPGAKNVKSTYVPKQKEEATTDIRSQADKILGIP